MQHILAWLRAICWIFLVFLVVVGEYAAANSSDDKLELWFEHNGHQAILSNPPRVICFSQGDSRVVKCDLYHSGDARYWISRPTLPGSYILYITATKDGNEYYRAYPYTVDQSTTGPLLVALNRVLHLQVSRDNEGDSGGQEAGCRTYDKYAVPVLALFPAVGLNITWDPMEEADRYHYKVWRVRCSDDTRIEPVAIGNVPINTLKESLPANNIGEYYSLELYARHGAQDIGQLLTGGESETMRDSYPFTVADPLGDRSWYPYLFLAVAAPFALLLIGWILRTVASVRPGKGFAWTGVAILLVITGYLQFQTLQGWFEQGGQLLQYAGQFSQKWYRSSVKDDGYTVRQSFTGGDWSGYLVAVGNEPFYGDRRRVEMRISFNSETARVSLMQDGRWRDVTGSAFTISKSGTGMTLIGHQRAGQERELWSISIPDINDTALRPVLDRLITVHDLKGHTASVRRQAIGELYHGLP